MTQDLLARYGLFEARAPRYTSYPTAPHFSQGTGPGRMAAWLLDVPEGARVSLYVHIPFCQRLCWFCACRTQGTRTLAPLRRYLDTLKIEIAQIAALLPPGVRVGRMHWGGGTPTILPPEMIAELGAALKDAFDIASDAEISVEIDPTCVDDARLAALRDIGLNRASIGVQDFDAQVQQAIGREQSFERTRDVVAALRAAGVGGINLDLLYGLPHQTSARMAATLDRVLTLAPERIALYGYAHVPWVAKRQALIAEAHLPDGPARLALFAQAAARLGAGGYAPVGIDHFAKPGDGLHVAAAAGRLRRNFQGYTDDDLPWLIGLGASAVSRMPQGYAQNDPATSGWQDAVRDGRLATVRGHLLSPEDRLIAAAIEELLCQFRLTPARVCAQSGANPRKVHALMQELLTGFPDLVRIEGGALVLRPGAAPLVRIVAAALDRYDRAEMRYSRAI